MKKQVIINALVFDIDTHTKEQIEGCLALLLAQKGHALPFKYDKTNDGYEFTYQRNLHYGYLGNFIIDLDCAFITGLQIEDFQINPLDPTHRPLLFGVLGRNTDGFYIDTSEFEKLYAKMISSCGGEKPSKVSVYACDSYVTVNVKY